MFFHASPFFGHNAFDLSGGPPYVERLRTLREARPYHSVRSWDLLAVTASSADFMLGSFAFEK
jgi:hypothetical protein